MRRFRSCRCALAAAACWGASIAPQAAAQEAFYTQAATMPSPGTAVVRERLRFSEFGSGPGVEEIQKLELTTSVQYGLERDLSVTFDLPLAWRAIEEAGEGGAEEENRDEAFGVDDLNLMLKWRFYREDTGGVDTKRAALLLGAALPSGSNIAGSSVDPYIGAVYTQVLGRHGFNQDAIFRLNTGGADDANLGGEGSAEALLLNTAYLYRLAPPVYTAETTASYYGSFELSTIYETNGDLELRAGPGFMFEGREWAWEVSLQFPVYQDVEKRPELDFSIAGGIRILF